ncbi:MAG: 3-oxoacyl-[acyl-carrier-protein] reductase [Bacillota bacterium]|nr:3-oxoacyl-[acyl-carrier-protein] reductase [Bacillota bacterium]
MRFKDKVAVVTGSGRGIGRAIAIKLASEGANVTVTDVNLEGCNAVRAEIERAGGKAIAVRCDVTDRRQVAAMMEETVKAFGKLDILVNNAGITRDSTLVKMTDEQWDAVLTTNLKSVFICIQEAAKYMLPQNCGRIISITSIAAQEGGFGQANYAAAKAGIIGMTKTLSKELGRKGITVNCVAPGFIVTDMTAAIPEKYREQLIARIPVGRPGQPEDVAAAVAFLASDEASFINGHTLNVNGGMYV